MPFVLEPENGICSALQMEVMVGAKSEHEIGFASPRLGLLGILRALRIFMVFNVSESHENPIFTDNVIYA